MFFRRPKPKGEHFYNTPQDKRQREYERWVKKFWWICGSTFLVFFVLIVGVVGYGWFAHADPANPFRDPIVVPIRDNDLSRMV